MTAFRTLAFASGLVALTAGCGDGGQDLARYSERDTMMDVCAEAVFDFDRDSASLSEAAEESLFGAVDKVAVDCEGARIDITAFAEEAGDQIVYARTATVENAIVTEYGISETRIAKHTEEAPSGDLANHVRVALMVEVPVIDE